MRLKLYRGYWCVIYKDELGKPKRRSLRTKDRDEAERLFADQQRRPSGETVSDIFQIYADDKQGTASHPRILDAWKALKPSFGHYRPDQIDRRRCRVYVSKRSKLGRGAGTIRKELSILRAALRYNDKNTPAVIELPSDVGPREVWITKEEFDALYDAAEAYHIKLFLLLARFTAGRKEAILQLRWDSVSFANRQIALGRGSKNKRRATVPIGARLEAALKHAYENRTSEYVIEWAGDRVKSIRKGFDSAKHKAGLDHITPHDLRRSAARWMVEAGIPMEEVSQFLGHSNTTVTRNVYAKFSPDYLRKAAEALE